MSQKLSPVKLLQTMFDLLAEPRVKVQVVFHKLLDILIRATLVLDSGLFHFRLQLGRRLNFPIGKV